MPIYFVEVQLQLSFYYVHVGCSVADEVVNILSTVDCGAQVLAILLIFIQKRVTDRMLPCGISFWFCGSERVDPVRTLKLLCEWNFLMKSGCLPLKPKSYVLHNIKIPDSVVWLLQIEKIAVKRCFIFMKSSRMKVSRWIKFQMDPLFFRNPVSMLVVRLFDLVWFYGTSTIVGYFMPNPYIYIYSSISNN